MTNATPLTRTVVVSFILPEKLAQYAAQLFSAFPTEYAMEDLKETPNPT